MKSLEHLKNFNNCPVLYLGLKLTIYVIKSRIHLVRQSLHIQMGGEAGQAASLLGCGPRVRRLAAEQPPAEDTTTG